MMPPVPVVPWPGAPGPRPEPPPGHAADDDPRMAAVAVLLEDAWRILEQVREILGLPAREASERART